MNRSSHINIFRHRRPLGAFTLIELLVVIAIIAILAAILFPVFAQAKMAAKKAAAISDAKQTGTSIIMYTGDSDDLGPLGTVPNLSSPVQRYRPNDDTAQNPAGWFNYPGAQDEYALVWNNTTDPYRKSYDLMNPPGTKEVNVSGPIWSAGYGAQLKRPVPCNLTYNGFLQGYSMTAIASPSVLPMVWQGTGNASVNGAAMANPRLRCTGTGPCVFSSSGMPQPDATGGGMYTITLSNRGSGGPTYNPYNGNVVVASDTSAKVHKFATNRGAYPGSINSINILRDVDTDGYIPGNPGDPIYIRGQYRSGILFLAGMAPDNNYAN